MTAFETGAVREDKTGKGRPDLVPLEMIADLAGLMIADQEVKVLLQKMDTMQQATLVDNKYSHAISVLYHFASVFGLSLADIAIKAAQHYELGLEKHPENNWKKGIPERSYIASAYRHLFAHQSGDASEPHDAAFIWNMLGLAWSYKNIKDYTKEV